MSLNHLLLWLSAKGEGSWSQFRAAVEELHVQAVDQAGGSNADGELSVGSTSELPVYQEVRLALQCLGHVEFFSRGTENRWRVVPATITFTRASEKAGLLCGARTPTLLERLSAFQDVRTEVLESSGMPDRVLLRGASADELALSAMQIGLYIQREAPVTLLSALPTVRDQCAWVPADLPATPGWSVHCFSSSKLRWSEVGQEDVVKAQTGLFRFAMKHQRFYYLRWKGSSYRVPVQVGKFAVMSRRRGILTYNADSCVLSVPAICRPPLLIERALVLCSGVLPHFQKSSRSIEYADVPPDVARLAAQLLCQEVA